MMRSLYSGVSGLKNHQTRMDVIGNNIANVNTIAFKSSRVVFQDIYSQMIKTASAGTADRGGTNPSQIGLGVMLSTIDVIHTSAPTQRTDNPLDVAIEGDGYFVVSQTGDPTKGYLYTRAGNFCLDNLGNIVTSDGYFVMGYGITATEVTPEVTDPISGEVITPAVYEYTVDDTSMAPINVNGYTSISIDETGMIWGIKNDVKEPISVFSLGMFSNNMGLEKKGGSMYAATGASGDAQYTVARTDGAGKINPGGLEMSNVDLAAEFTDMIITQRGFQANSRIITTSDSMLEELVNLKR